jgi:hypothetical protein
MFWLLVGIIIAMAFAVGMNLILQAKKRRHFIAPTTAEGKPPNALLGGDVVGIIRVQKKYLGGELTPTAETYDLFFTQDRVIVVDLKYPFATDVLFIPIAQVPTYAWDNYIGELSPKELGNIHPNNFLELEKFSIRYADIEKVEIKRVRTGGALRILCSARKYNFALKGVFRNPQRFEDYVSILRHALPQKTIIA